MDRKSRMRLLRWGFLLLMVFYLDQSFQPSDPIDNYSLEWEINGTTYRQAGDTTYIMIDGTPVPFVVNGTRVGILDP